MRWFVGAITALAATAAAAAETGSGGPTSGVDMPSLMRVTLGLLVVVGAIVGLMWLLRRMGGVGGSAGGQMRIVGALSVGNRERVVLVEVGDKQLLVGVAPGRVQTLHVLDEPLEVPRRGNSGATAAGTAFGERLRQVMQNHEKRNRWDDSPH